MYVPKEFEHLKLPLEDIISATNNFAENNCIGRGGFGKVYKGELIHSNGHATVALKRLAREFGQGDREFWNEILMLSLYKHKNIVSLIGFCEDSGEKILVYEYASKRGLDLYLNDNDLRWVQRLKICIGAARGLAFLHSDVGTQQRVLHRDIKSANILLDDNWNARIADFGLSKFGPANLEYSLLFSNPVGTYGYFDPLYGETGLLTKESDVYSFGVVLFEVLCGRLCFRNKDDRQPFTELVQRCYEQKNLDGIIYGNIKDEISRSSLEEFATIAYKCLKRDRKERPLMNDVVTKLEAALRYQVPPRPPPSPPPPPPPPPPRSKSNYVSPSAPPTTESNHVSPPPALPESNNMPPLLPESNNVPPLPSLSGVDSPACSNQRSLKPLHWVKSRALVGSLWDVSDKQLNQSRAFEIDVTELESLFSTVVPGSGTLKPETVRLVHPSKAHYYKIMLRKAKIPLPGIINATLALDSSAVNVDQVDNLIKAFPTKEEIEKLKRYTGDKEMLGQYEQDFLECAKIPRIKRKLRVFSFTITFSTQVKKLTDSLYTVNETTIEIQKSTKLAEIMHTILKIGNTLNAGTDKGSAEAFKLSSLEKLGNTHATSKKITLLHFLCKVVSEQMPELLDFDKDLIHLQAADKIQLRTLAEDMQALSKGREMVDQELDALKSDESIYARFREALESFLDSAAVQLLNLVSLFSKAGRNADLLSLYLGEDPSRYPWEQVISSLVRFIKVFKKAHDENKQWAGKKNLEEVVDEEEGYN